MIAKSDLIECGSFGYPCQDYFYKTGDGPEMGWVLSTGFMNQGTSVTTTLIYAVVNSKIDEILNSWYNAKEQISLLEKKCDKYKKQIEAIMDSNEKDVLKSSLYTVNKRNISRKSVSRETLPKDIFEKYATYSVYSSLYISKNKNDFK